MGVEDTQPLISHLIELRKRLINSIIAILVIFLALVYFANDIYQLVSAPLIPADAGGCNDDRHRRGFPFLYGRSN
ncbi:Twin-arginine translocation protein TatC [Raoultella ornithinolytica]|nr:Twin-arginine translocation protein TatC [Raoultella ornithinolytica]